MVKTDKVGCVMRPVALGIAAASTLGLGLLGFPGCSSKPAGSAATKAEPPAKVAVSKLRTEADLVVVTLKPEAETRLGIATAQVVRKPTPRSLTIGGDVVVPPGRASIVSAPQTGMLVIPDGGSAPEPGLTVEKGKTIFTLLPILSADRAVLNPIERVNFGAAKAAAEGQKKTAQSRFDNAKTILERTEQLTRNRDVPPSTLVDARNSYDQAKATLDAANDAWSIFSKAMGDGANDADAGKLAPLALKSPADGVLIQVMVQPGQQVTAGSILFEVAALDPIYVKVPVFVGEERTIATDRPAAVGGLSDAPGSSTVPAKPVRTSPTANALTSTIDLYYEVANADHHLRPGQKVGIALPMKGESESLVVPSASVLRDINGGAWVYEAMGKHAFARRRVVVDRVEGAMAVLAMGPKPGTNVVTDGAAELFGTEFAGGK